MHITVKPKLIFETSYPFTVQYEFHTPNQLRKYLSHINPMEPHKPLNYATGLPKFRLGTQLQFKLMGNECRSDVDFERSFIFARDVTVDKQGHVIADVPTDDAFVSPDGKIHRHFSQQVINPHRVDAIIEPFTLKQLWPHKHQNHSVLNKFLGWASRERVINTR